MFRQNSTVTGAITAKPKPKIQIAQTPGGGTTVQIPKSEPGEIVGSVTSIMTSGIKRPREDDDIVS